MKKHFAVASVMILVAAALSHGQRRGRPPWGGSANAPPPLAKTDREKTILSVLSAIQESGRTFSSVPEADGRLLRLLTEATNARSVVEIGTSTGYSGLWFCLALEKTGGKLTTFELDRGRAAMARQHFQQAGVDRVVTIVEGDAHERIKELKGPLDVAFIDADKEGYVDYVEKLLPLVRPGGLIAAHNVGPAMGGEGYVQRVTGDPDLETIFYMDGAGLSVTLKKR